MRNPAAIQGAVITMGGCKGGLGELKTVSARLAIPFMQVSATLPNDLFCCNAAAVHLHEGLLRPMTCAEVATSISHQRARITAFNTGADWALVVEEDAQIADAELLARIQTNLPDMWGPCIINLFAEQFGVLGPVRADGLRQMLLQADGAVAYLINREASEILNQAAPLIHRQLADWPNASRQARLFASSWSCFSHVPPEFSPSSLESGRRSRMAGRSSIQRMRERRLLHWLQFALFRIVTVPYGSNWIYVEQLRTRAKGST